MNDFDRYAKEFFLVTKHFNLKKALRHYELPKNSELHNMICNPKDYLLVEDRILFDTAGAKDYFEYEKELWNLEKPN